jgi:nitroreductase
MSKNLEKINDLLNKKETIINECVHLIEARFSSRTKEKCHRDLTYITNAIISDLLFDTSIYTMNTANKFWYDGERQIKSYKTEFIVYELLKNKIKSIYGNNQRVNDLFNLLKTIIVQGPLQTQNQSISQAALTTQHCQRNWDYDAIISENDIATLIDIATSMPTKQNLSFYKLIVSTDREFNHFCFTNAHNPNNNDTFTRNTQVDAPLLLLWCWDPQAEYDNKELLVPDESISINYQKSVMISLGATILTAAQLGYRTGFCQCAVHEPINEKLKEKFNRDLQFSGTFLGIGAPNPNAENWYEVLDSNNNITRIVYPNIKKEIDVCRLI